MKDKKFISARRSRAESNSFISERSEESNLFILWFKDISLNDVPLVGGKNASLGEMFSKLTQKGINVPDGFALTTNFYWQFLKTNGLDSALKNFLKGLNTESIKSIQKTGKLCRDAISRGEFTKELKLEVFKSYSKLCQEYGANAEVAVRTSGVAEDMPSASFAGQFETYLNIKGKEKLLGAVKKSIVSTFTDRAIAYRAEKKIGQMEFGLSVGVQKMVRSDLGSAGIIFTIDTETGFSNVISISSIWGVGELIVKGMITPDQFYVFKPTLKEGFKPIIVKNLGRKNRKYIFASSGGVREVPVGKINQLEFSLNDDEILKLAKWALIIEQHYGRPQDIEWAKDGKTGQLFVVQSRPETVQILKNKNSYQEYVIKTGKLHPVLIGTAVGNKIGQGKAKIISDVSKISQFKKGEVLVARMTDPDWVPAMREASAIVTDEGGKTAHAAIVSRELGLPCIVGTKSATKIFKNGQFLTVDCTQGLIGRIFQGKVSFKINSYDLRKIPKTKTKIMMNVGVPESAFAHSFLPSSGVGLAREEFIIAQKIKVHPLALYHFKTLKNNNLKRKIEEITVEHKNKREFFVKELAEGIGQIAAAFWPKPVIVRFSDFKTNEYRNLIGGELFEPKEENPMIGFRGASRYYDENFKPAFEMECEAIKRVRETFGLKNIWLMVPFCRTIDEGKKVIALMEKFGLKRDGLKIIVMCEIPSNVELAQDFLKIFDGMSIGSNDLTQLVLGLDRDSAVISHIGDERNQAPKEMIAKVIKICKENKKYCGICGEAPSTFPEFTEFLVEQGIESMSLNPDTVIKTIIQIAKKESASRRQKQ